MIFIFDRTKAKYGRMGIMWQKQLTVAVWELWYEVWAMRNAQVHRHTTRVHIFYALETNTIVSDRSLNYCLDPLQLVDCG
jgi:hypothetical protein